MKLKQDVAFIVHQCNPSHRICIAWKSIVGLQRIRTQVISKNRTEAWDNLRVTPAPLFECQDRSIMGGTSFPIKDLNKSFHRRVDLSSAARLLNRDIVTFYSQGYFSWKMNWTRIVWKLLIVLSTIPISENNLFFAHFVLFETLKKNNKSS